MIEPTAFEQDDDWDDALAEDLVIRCAVCGDEPIAEATFAEHLVAVHGEPEVHDTEPVLELVPEPDRDDGAEQADDPNHTHPGRRYWSREAILEAIREFERRNGRPPIQKEAHHGNGLPSCATVHSYCGSWAQAIEDAGFPRPLRGGGRVLNGVHLNADGDQPRFGQWIRVRGTGLAYRTPEEAYVAADEIEQDGERVARAARVEGDEAKADLAIDRANALAAAVRAAGQLADPEARTLRVLEQPELEPPASDVDTRRVAAALIKAARAALDVLEAELT